MRAVLRVALLVSALLLLAARPARADDEAPENLPRRPAVFAWEKGILRATLSYRDVIDEAATRKLSSGIPIVIAMRAYVLPEGESEPVALAVRSCRVVYDLWDEVYRVKVSGPEGEKSTAAINVEGVLRQCGEVRAFPVVARAVLQAGRAHFLGIIAEVNPVSPEMLEQMRRWVSRPAGSTGIGPGDALFGSFVGLFVRRIGAADRVVRFRTQPLTP